MEKSLEFSESLSVPVVAALLEEAFSNEAKEAIWSAFPWAGYFWNWEYRHDLRNAGLKARKAVYKAFVAADLPLTGVSPEHAAIIHRLTA